MKPINATYVFALTLMTIFLINLTACARNSAQMPVVELFALSECPQSEPLVRLKGTELRQEGDATIAEKTYSESESCYRVSKSGSAVECGCPSPAETKNYSLAGIDQIHALDSDYTRSMPNRMPASK